MFIRVVLTAGLFAALASAAAAQEVVCAEPIEPLLPKTETFAEVPLEAARTQILAAFADVKKFQGELKSYRACLQAAMKQAQVQEAQAIATNKPDNADKSRQVLEGAERRYNATIDREQGLANQANGLKAVHCARDKGWAACG